MVMMTAVVSFRGVEVSGLVFIDHKASNMGGDCQSRHCFIATIVTAIDSIDISDTSSLMPWSDSHSLGSSLTLTHYHHICSLNGDAVVGHDL